MTGAGSGVEPEMPDVPDWRQKQQLLYGGKASREQRLEGARRLIEKGMDSEAMDYLEVEPDGDLVRTLLDRALDKGEAFQYRRAAAVLGLKPSAADWEKVAERAEASGRPSYARLARAAAAAGDGDGKGKQGKADS
jgi:hypothetical protein